MWFNIEKFFYDLVFGLVVVLKGILLFLYLFLDIVIWENIVGYY